MCTYKNALIPEYRLADPIDTMGDAMKKHALISESDNSMDESSTTLRRASTRRIIMGT